MHEKEQTPFPAKDAEMMGQERIGKENASDL